LQLIIFFSNCSFQKTKSNQKKNNKKMMTTEDKKFSMQIDEEPVYRDRTFSTIRDPPVCKNIVSVVIFGVDLDLRRLSRANAQCEYDPTSFAACITRCGPSKSCALINASSKTVVIGCKTLHEIEVACRHYARMLWECGHTTLGRYKFQVQNCVMTTRVPYKLDLPRIHAAYPSITSYVPDKFPGLIFNFNMYSIKVLAFKSGRFNIVGFRTPTQGMRAYETAMEIIPKFELPKQPRKPRQQKAKKNQQQQQPPPIISNVPTTGGEEKKTDEKKSESETPPPPAVVIVEIVPPLTPLAPPTLESSSTRKVDNEDDAETKRLRQQASKKLAVNPILKALHKQLARGAAEQKERVARATKRPASSTNVEKAHPPSLVDDPIYGGGGFSTALTNNDEAPAKRTRV
jgi:transcription initiation factor TFIID TATA-box-binding protein